MKPLRCILLLGLMIYLLACGQKVSIAATTNFTDHAGKAYEDAQAKYKAATNDLEADWQFARACFDRADFAASKSDRAKFAEQGITVCRQLLVRDTNSAAGHYYLAMNYGQLARTKTLGALKLVSQMEDEFTIALRLDPKFDYAGPSRGLGLLYLQAPGWPTSVGSKSKAKTQLEKAVVIAPDFPENWLNLIEADAKWDDKSAQQRDLKSLDELWDKAKAKFTGDQWAASWADWESRRAALKKPSAKKAVSPKRSSDE